MFQHPDRIRIGANGASAVMAILAAYCFYRFNWLTASGAAGGHIAPWTTANAILRVVTPATWAFAIVSTWVAGDRKAVTPALRWARRLGAVAFAPMVFCLAFWVFSKVLTQLPL